MIHKKIPFGLILFLGLGNGITYADSEPLKNAKKEKIESARIEFLDLSNMEINEVLKVISDSTEWNIVPSPEVKGKVFAYLKDIDAETALKKLVEMNGYRFIREGNVVTIMTEKDYELKMGAETQQKIYKLKYARPAEIIPFLIGALSAKGQAVAAPSGRNPKNLLYERTQRRMPWELQQPGGNQSFPHTPIIIPRRIKPPRERRGRSVSSERSSPIPERIPSS